MNKHTHTHPSQPQLLSRPRYVRAEREREFFIGFSSPHYYLPFIGFCFGSMKTDTICPVTSGAGYKTPGLNEMSGVTIAKIDESEAVEVEIDVIPAGKM